MVTIACKNVWGHTSIKYPQEYVQKIWLAPTKIYNMVHVTWPRSDRDAKVQQSLLAGTESRHPDE